MHKHRILSLANSLMNGLFLMEERQMANTHLEKNTAVLTVGEVQIKTTLRLRLFPIIMDTVKRASESDCC